ncbi:MAG: folate family ECF transporter S component [Clostridia bacterium]|nr:folate family ECF transporter S component [Clostridia bacterium]
MGKFFKTMVTDFAESAKGLKNTRRLALAGMLLALYAVLGLVKIPLFTPDNRITFTFAATAAAGMVLGPVPAMLVGGLGDILGYVLNPGGGAYFFGFTISGMLGGLIYGLCLYKAHGKWTIVRIIVAVFIITLFVNIILNTCWLSVMYAKAYTIFASARIIKNLVAFPVHVIVIFAVHLLLERTNLYKKL